MERDAELRLVAALRVGDEQVFGEVYEALRPRLFTFILRMVNRRAIAEELSQEVWMRLAVRAASLREDTRLEAWLFTVARNLCLSYWRTRGVEGVFDETPETIGRVAASSPAPDEKAESRELRAELERALARLPRPFREVLLLVGVEGMTPAEAAGVCGISPEAMRKRLERARHLLAARLQPTHTRPGVVEEER